MLDMLMKLGLIAMTTLWIRGCYVRMAKVKKTEHDVHDINYMVWLIIAGAGCVMPIAATVTFPTGADVARACIDRRSI